MIGGEKSGWGRKKGKKLRGGEEKENERRRRRKEDYVGEGVGKDKRVEKCGKCVGQGGGKEEGRRKEERRLEEGWREGE